MGKVWHSHEATPNNTRLSHQLDNNPISFKVEKPKEKGFNIEDDKMRRFLEWVDQESKRQKRRILPTEKIYQDKKWEILK